MSPNHPAEPPGGRDGSSKYIVPLRAHRILDTTTQMAESALALIRSRHPEAIRVHSISALVWLFRVRRAFGRYWRCDASLTGSGILCERLYRLRRLVTRCHASTLSRIAATVPFSDVSTDGTRGCDPALFDDERYRLLTDNDLACITREIREHTEAIRVAVVALRRALWAELDRVQGCPPSPSIKDPEEVDAFFRAEERAEARAERKRWKRERSLALSPKAQAQRGNGPANASDLPTTAPTAAHSQCRTLADLANCIRRERPRQRNVPRLLELLSKRESLTFDEIADLVHEAQVDDSAIEKTIRQTQHVIVKAGLPYRLVTSNRTVRLVHKST